jgi:hypothetical protein
VTRAAALALVGALGLAVAGCATTPPVTLSDRWPERAGDYDDVNQTWTRTAKLRGSYQQALEVHATLRSPEWRAAHAGREASIRKLDAAARDALFAEARTAAAGDYEVALVVTTYDRSENDLHRGERSVWRLALVDDAGVETAPLKVVRDRRPLEILRAELPILGDFAEVYVATFPRTAAVLRDGAHRVALKMWSVKGGVELVWTSK